MSAENILVVEDEAVSMRVLTSLLQAQGYQVTRAANLAAALQEVRKAMPNLIVLDLNVLSDDPFSGLTDGFSFLRLLRRNHPNDCPPVIVHTVENSAKAKATAKDLGVAAFLVKGCSPTELLAAVRTVLDALPAAKAG